MTDQRASAGISGIQLNILLSFSYASNTMAKITDIVVKSLAPDLSTIDKDVAKLLPTRYAQAVSCKISGVSNAVSNAIRRTISNELSVFALIGDTVETDDVFIIEEMVLRRLRLIPIDQSGGSHDRFMLDVRNDGLETRDVKMGEVKSASGGKVILPFNTTFTLCTLRPGCKLRIPLITKRIDRGYNFAGHCIASNVSTAIAQTAESSTSTSTSVSVSDPREWILRFNTNGTMDPRDIIRATLDDLSERVRAALMHGHRDFDGTNHLLVIPGETDTIGNLIMKTVIDLRADIPAVIYRTSTYSREVTIVVNLDGGSGNAGSDDTIMALYTEVGEYLLGTFEQLAAGV